MRDLSKSLPRELVSILEPLLAYRVGDYSLKTSCKSKTSTISISFDLDQKKRPLGKAQAKPKSQEKSTPAPILTAPRTDQKARPPRVKKIPPVSVMEIEESLPTTQSPAALGLAPLESRGEGPFRSPEGTGHGRKMRKRREISSPDTPPRPTPTPTKAMETQTTRTPTKSTETQTATTQGPSLNNSQVQTDPVEEPEVEEDIRVELSQQASLILEQHQVHPSPVVQNASSKVYPSSRPLPPMVMVQYLGQERFEHEIHAYQDLSDFLADCEVSVSPTFVSNVAARLTTALFQEFPPGELSLARRLLAGLKQ